MFSGKKEITTNREACPICRHDGRNILFSAKHNSKGFIDFIKLEAYFSQKFYDAFYNSVLNQLVYEIAECDQCDFIYLTEVLNNNGCKYLEEEWLNKEMLTAHYSKLPFIPLQVNMLDIIKRHFSFKEKTNLLHWGNRYGNFVSLCIEKGFNTFVYDSFAPKNENSNSTGATVLNETNDYKKHFSFIWANQVFQRLADPLEALQTIKENLADDGYIYIAVPDCSDIKKILSEKGLSYDLFRLLSPHQHINAFTHSTLKMLGAASGLKPVGFGEYLKLYNTKLGIPELKLLMKKTINNTGLSTGLLFKKI